MAEETKRDYYEILESQKDAAAGDLQTAFRRLAKANHPDRNPGDKAKEARFRKVIEAYDVLRDADRRARYDAFGHDAFQEGNADVLSARLAELVRILRKTEQHMASVQQELDDALATSGGIHKRVQFILGKAEGISRVSGESLAMAKKFLDRVIKGHDLSR